MGMQPNVHKVDWRGAIESGVSRHVNVAGPGFQPGVSTSGSGRTQRFGIVQIAEEKARASQRYKNLTAGLGRENMATLAAIRGDNPEGADDVGEGGDSSQQDFLMDFAPVGEDPGPETREDDGWEDVAEEESIAHAIRDLIDAHTSVRVTKDTRTWAQRVRNMDENWKPRIPFLVAAYQHWKYSKATPDSPPRPTSEVEIDVLDIFSGATTVKIPIIGDQSFPEAIVHAGYLGTTPIFPTLAISLKTLELFRVIRLFKASFSVEAFAKMLCYMYYIPYRRQYRTALADTFDVYLTILSRVEDQVMAALGQNDPDWRAVHGCPACSYEVQDEEPPTWSRMIVLDGNNSLKRMAMTGGRVAGDVRVFNSDYYLSRDFVNEYANEVRSRQAQAKPDLLPDSDQEDDEDDGAPPDRGAYPTDGKESNPCASHWKAAASDETKKMWGMFEETGIFASACRHALILWLVDMVRSGELAKYPLAIVAQALEKIAGKKLFGYDIGCAFGETVLYSRLKEAFQASGSRFCVNAFHGYSHSYDCQCQHHPNIITGIGLEELETLERIFSASNQLAPVIRYASPYRRVSFIHAFFRQWDSEKYANIGLFLYNNYTQALDVIEKNTGAVSAALQELGFTAEQLTEFDREERSYFTNLRDEDEANLWTITYVETLQALQKASEDLLDTSKRLRTHAPRQDDGGVELTFLAPQTGRTDYSADLSATRRLERSRRVLLERVDRLTAEAIAIEDDFNFDRWQPTDERYVKTVDYINNRQYHRALGKLQRLVIQRLFELHKLNLSQTGYKARTYLAKSLQRRCKAIRNAVKRYNEAAQRMKPPRPALDWDRVSHYSFLEEFPLLQETRADVLEKPWTRPEVREVIRASRRLTRAHEEIRNANREVRRMHTWIRDEEILFRNVAARLLGEQDPLRGAFEEYCRHRRAANARNLAYIQAIYDLQGFSGVPSPGRHVNASHSSDIPGAIVLAPEEAEAHNVLQELSEDAIFQEDDSAGGEVAAIIEYLAGLAV